MLRYGSVDTNARFKSNVFLKGNPSKHFMKANSGAVISFSRKYLEKIFSEVNGNTQSVSPPAVAVKRLCKRRFEGTEDFHINSNERIAKANNARYGLDDNCSLILQIISKIEEVGDLEKCIGSKADDSGDFKTPGNESGDIGETAPIICKNNVDMSTSLLEADCYTSAEDIFGVKCSLTEHISRELIDQFNQITNVSEMNSDSTVKSATDTDEICTGLTLHEVMDSSDGTNSGVDLSENENGKLLEPSSIDNTTGCSLCQIDYNNYGQGGFSSSNDSEGNDLESSEVIFTECNLSEITNDAEENLRVEAASTPNCSRIKSLHPSMHTEFDFSNNVTNVRMHNSVEAKYDSKPGITFDECENPFGCIGQEYKGKNITKPAEKCSKSLKNVGEKETSTSFIQFASNEIQVNNETAKSNEKPKQAINFHQTASDRFNRNKRSNLAFDNECEIWSDFCLKFGHSTFCLYGESCKFKGKDKCVFCNLYCLPRNDLQGKQKHEDYCISKCVRKKTDIYGDEKETTFCSKTCNLCKSVVSRKSHFLHKRFYAILPKCDHVFCLECAEECRTDLPGRDRLKIIICRICKRYSTFYAASARWIAKEHKREFLRNYVESVKMVRCKFCTVESKSEVQAGSNICYHGRTIPSYFCRSNL